jgi:hypothetical protein
MAWSASVVRRAVIPWPRRHPPQPARRRARRSPYWDAHFADPNVVEDDYWRMRRRQPPHPRAAAIRALCPDTLPPRRLSGR